MGTEGRGQDKKEVEYWLCEFYSESDEISGRGAPVRCTRSTRLTRQRAVGGRWPVPVGPRPLPRGALGWEDETV
jgi:hypothetical protein